MKYAVALVNFLAVGTCMGAQSSLVPDRVDKAIHERIAAGEYPALVIAVVDGDRSEIYGFGKLDNGKAPDADTVFEIGSVTKTFTATLLARAVLAGELKLDTPVGTLLAGFTIPSRNGKTITLENLAMQHSGLPRLPTNFAPANENDPYADYDGDKLKAFLAGYTLHCRGTQAAPMSTRISVSACSAMRWRSMPARLTTHCCTRRSSNRWE